MVVTDAGDKSGWRAVTGQSVSIPYAYPSELPRYSKHLDRREWWRPTEAWTRLDSIAFPSAQVFRFCLKQYVTWKTVGPMPESRCVQSCLQDG